MPSESIPELPQDKNRKQYAPDSTGLFVLSNGAFASREWFLGGLNQILPGANVAGQSFRAGGATHLAMRGAPRIVLQRLGRWNSNTFEQYIRTQPAIVVALSEPYVNSTIAQSLTDRRPATHHLGTHGKKERVSGDANGLGCRPPRNEPNRSKGGE